MTPPTKLKTLAAALACALAADGAGAQTPPAPWGASAPLPPPPAAAPQALTPEASLARLDATLGWFEDSWRRQRTAVTIAGAAVGVSCLGIGASLVARDDRDTRYYGLLAGSLGLGALLGVGLVALLPGPMDAVRASYDESRARRDAPLRTLAATERAWRERAERSRRMRTVTGVTLAVVSGLSLISGAVLLFVDAPTSRERSVFRVSGATLVGLGAFAGLASAGVMYAADPLEQGWEVYARTRVAPLSVGVSPVPGGAMVGLGGAF